MTRPAVTNGMTVLRNRGTADANMLSKMVKSVLTDCTPQRIFYPINLGHGAGLEDRFKAIRR
jgi:hypothetical protein